MVTSNLMKKALPKARAEQLMRERGYLEPGPEEGIIVERSKHPFPQSMRDFVERRKREREAVPLPIDPGSLVRVNVCVHCSGRGCGEETVRHGDLYCVQGTTYDRPSVYRLKQVFGLCSAPGFKKTILPAINTLHQFFDLDLDNAHVSKHEVPESRQDGRGNQGSTR